MEISQFVKIFYPKVPQKVSIMLRYLNKSWKVSTNLSRIDENLDTAKSRLKSHDFKNLDREKKVGLDCQENLGTLKKLVSTDQDVSILIALDCRDPQAKIFLQIQMTLVFHALFFM